MKTAFLAFRALLSAVLFFVLWGWLDWQVRGLDAAYGLALPAWAQSLTIPVTLLGVAIAYWCVATFVVRGRGTPAPFDPPREFVAVGPYRYLRNPMYIGGALMLAGFGLFERSGAMVLFCIPFLLFFHLFVVFYEEPTLRAKFGGTYEQYLSEVPRWIPRRPRSARAAGGRA